MLAAERHRDILIEAGARGSVRVIDLSDRFGVTEETIRRDLDKLQEAGKLRRTHGGAVLVQSDEHESPHWKRERINEEEKRAIAREAATLVQEGDSLMLDASSTAWYLAKYLPDMPLVVITNASQIAVVLAGHVHVKTICLGGTLSPSSLSFVGPMAEENLKGYHANWAFLSCRAVDLERGISDGNEQQARLRQIMIRRSDRTCLMADHSKFGKNALALIAPVEAVDLLITDQGNSRVALQKLNEMFETVRVAGL